MRAILIAVLVFVAALPAVSGPQKAGKTKGGGGGAEAQLEQQEKDRAQAVIKGDTAALDQMTADDYVLTDVNGKVRTKAETMDAIKSGAIKLSSNDISDIKVHVYGNTAVVTGKSDAKGMIDGKDVGGPVRFTRVYVKRNGKWQSVAFQQTKIAE
jgi:ketosteroid isomerase-like protein